MPFTAAHPLAVIPLVRGHRWLRLDPTCLVIGSMAPDFEYFARGEQISTISHTLRGLWLWDLPATLVLAVVAHLIVKWPALLVAPVAIVRRALPVRRAWPWPWRVATAVSCCAAALIGSATHLAWDTFTHADGWGPHHFHALTRPVRLPVLGPMVLHRVLQHASTVVGLVAVAVIGPRALIAAFALAAIALTTRRLIARHATDPGDLIVGVIAGALAGGLVACALLAGRARRFARAVTSA
jgi:hypothetical protein